MRVDVFFPKDSFSLPTQRCFPAPFQPLPLCALFSAYAEVFPWFPYRRHDRRPFLCLRRGVSTLRAVPNNIRYFSLPTQRCFLTDISAGFRDGLFSAYAEVFPGSTYQA